MVQRITSWCLIALCLLMIAADPQPKGIKVVIATNDGKTVSGEFVDANEDHVRYKPSPKSDEIITLDWSEIKRVSNGITRQKVIDDMKKLFPERKCETCKGEGNVTCEKCHGTGVDPDQAVDCETCKGTASVGKCPRCKEGHIPCTATCIKEAQFNGKPKDKDGKRWIKMNDRKGGGSVSISDGHVGDLVVYEDGRATLKGKCPTCTRTTIIDCPLCHATGNKDCPKCLAGKTGPACPDCKEGKIPDAICGGTGLKKAAE